MIEDIQDVFVYDNQDPILENTHFQAQPVDWFQELNCLNSIQIPQNGFFSSQIYDINFCRLLGQQDQNHQPVTKRNKDITSTQNKIFQNQDSFLIQSTAAQSDQKKNIFTNEETNISEKVQDSIKYTQKQLFIYKKRRPALKIQINNSIEKSYLNSIKGIKQQTITLQKNFKRIILKLCQKSMKKNQFNKQTQQLIKNYEKSSQYSFNSTQQLFGLKIYKVNDQIYYKESKQTDTLRKQIYKQFSSADLIRQILQTKLGNRFKIVMIKFVDIKNLSITKPENHNKWKN